MMDGPVEPIEPVEPINVSPAGSPPKTSAATTPRTSFKEEEEEEVEEEEEAYEDAEELEEEEEEEEEEEDIDELGRMSVATAKTEPKVEGLDDLAFGSGSEEALQPEARDTDEIEQQIASAKKVKFKQKIRMSAKHRKDIVDAFNAFDVAGSGYMSTVDLRVALKALGFEARKPEMGKILDKYDKDKTGRLCYSDFMNIIEEKIDEEDSKEEIFKVFKLFDKDQTGHITFLNLRQVARELGEDVNDEELAEMIAEADVDDDGTLDQEEFLRILRLTTLY